MTLPSWVFKLPFLGRLLARATMRRRLARAKPFFTREQREAARQAMESVDRQLLERYGRLIYAAPPEELARIEADHRAFKKGGRSEASAAVLSLARDMESVGIIDKAALQSYEVLCAGPAPAEALARLTLLEADDQVSCPHCGDHPAADPVQARDLVARALDPLECPPTGNQEWCDWVDGIVSWDCGACGKMFTARALESGDVELRALQSDDHGA